MTELETLLAPSRPPWCMGILNVTPDSFSDGGAYTESDSACARGYDMHSAGAALIDIGGESTGPGAQAVSAEEEWRRIGPVVKKLSQDLVVSVDTFKAATADKALRAGARLINDVSALRYDPHLGSVIADHDAFVVLMHSKEADSSPHASDKEVTYSDIIADIRSSLLSAVDRALGAGIREERIIVDPGMGRFVSVHPEDSWELLSRLNELRTRDLPFPLLVSASRKGFLGGSLKHRDPASQLVHLLASQKGAHIIRTHRPDQFTEFRSIWNRLTVSSPG